jgi:hypothetical protein
MPFWDTTPCCPVTVNGHFFHDQEGGKEKYGFGTGFYVQELGGLPPNSPDERRGVVLLAVAEVL